ncbi:GNAT family protein [Hyphomicrobium sp.]|uniref:GNAT family N-acetyltransferase n=1 Tax=Hyphomicrobium sp. TaxID=82 RepID=UPI0025B94816|nr:GNAT family protein [Hyphomicrobium sp.]MCC7252205.1 GNAT family N-acetyltransferase [Hyphomicrobium sp.]
MAFLRAGNATEWAVIQGRGVWLRPPQPGDYVSWAELRALSRAHLVPWEPAWPRDDLTKSAYRRRIKHYQREARDDLGYAFLVFEAESDRLIGGLTLSNVRRGVTQSAMLGYWLGLPFVGKGHMTVAVRAVLPHAFESLRLHRVEAAAQPGNARSVGVLRRAGFVEEGLARRYLKINGTWQDHLLFAILAEDWMAREVER